MTNGTITDRRRDQLLLRRRGDLRRRDNLRRFRADGIPDLILLSFAIHDTAVHRRMHPAYLWGGLLVVASHPVRLAIGGTGAWLAFARWLTS